MNATARSKTIPRKRYNNERVFQPPALSSQLAALSKALDVPGGQRWPALLVAPTPQYATGAADAHAPLQLLDHGRVPFTIEILKPQDVTNASALNSTHTGLGTTMGGAAPTPGNGSTENESGHHPKPDPDAEAHPVNLE
jgi:hypothetical protein